MIGDKKILAYALKNAIENNASARVNNILNSLFAEGLKKDKIKETLPKVNGVVKKVNSMKPEEQKKEFSKLEKLIGHRKEREGLPELPNAEKGVVMRIAPSASGGLHIMHAINASLSYLYVKKYGGKFYVRIEDTNPENVDKKAYDLIKKDVEFLFGKKAKIVIQSERMNLYYRFAEKLISKGKVYVCTCSGDEFREFVKKKKDCVCRKLKVNENKERWERMLDTKGYKPGQAVLRFKSDMKDSNPALRDFPLARVNLESHPLTKKKFRVWPLMNLSVSVDDIDMKMTHIIRGKDHRDNAKRQELIFKVFKKKYPWTGFLGRYHFKDMELSTTKFKQGIKSRKYSGWDDIRLPTVASLRKRGYKPEAFHKMAEHIGLSEVDKTLSKKDFFDILDRFNK